MQRAVLMMVLAGVGVVLGGSGVSRGELAAQAPAVVPAQAAYVGEASCKKCHAPQHEAWALTKHARALSKLNSSDRKSGQCIRCHVTGTPEMILAEGADPSYPNVQCEACHGPGRAHVTAATEGNAASVRTITIVEETCTRCHNDTSPRYKAFYFVALKGLVHPIR